VIHSVPMREIVLDTETTGLDPEEGHRIVEVAGLELMNHVPTGSFFHRYVNPGRAMPADAAAVHGLTDDFLAAHGPFENLVDELLDFLGGDRLVIHNAAFDIRFLNAELARLGRPPLALPFADTLAMARKRFPGAPASLDALCKRFNVDNSNRSLHGAKLDCELLAAVYLELIGGRQPGLELAVAGGGNSLHVEKERRRRVARSFPASEAELERHRAFLGKLKSPIWLDE
jgi:DNA polymerase III subunit epsilon